MVNLLLVVVLLSVPMQKAGNFATPAKWQTFKGAYFEVNYPPDFIARKSLPSNSFEGDYDSAFFTSSDGSVEFYVFSPLWNGTPSDIERDPRLEEVVAEDLGRKGSIKTRRVTLKAKDNTYLRSFEDLEDSVLNTRRVFGIKYRDRNAYDKYRPQYLMFKKSLKQFAD